MKIIHSDCLEAMKSMQDNSIDFCITDPPYGLKFMGKKWDYDVPSVNCWKELLRILKPGSMIAVFAGSRTYHRMVLNIEDAGFEIRDCIMWIYGSGFPKSHNHFGFDGYGTALKPAYEPICLAMKPLEGTFAQNAEKWGVAGINIDECRIGTTVETWPSSKKYTKGLFGQSEGKGIYQNDRPIPNGRWPANVIFDEEAAQELDKQSGILKSGEIKPHHKFKLEKKNTFGQYSSKTNISMIGDSGGASRFFYCAKASPSERNAGLEGMPLKECKTGCGGAMPIDDNGNERDRFRKLSKNHHPTVKPLALMRYIIKLLAPPGNPILIDPFAGSGSTIVAAKELGISAIGIEKEAEYVEIARKRIDNAEWIPEQYEMAL